MSELRHNPISAKTLQRSNREVHDCRTAMDLLDGSCTIANKRFDDNYDRNSNMDNEPCTEEWEQEPGEDIGVSDASREVSLKIPLPAALSTAGSFSRDSPRCGARKERRASASLVERSKAFSNKLSGFMKDYSSRDTFKNMEDDTSNWFPTRINDIGRVPNQSVNLMDAESARYEYSDDELDYANADEEDVYANYTYGFTTPKDLLPFPEAEEKKRRTSLKTVVKGGVDYLAKSRAKKCGRKTGAKDHENAQRHVADTDKLQVSSPPPLSEALEIDDTCDARKKAFWWKEYSPCARWSIVLLLFLIGATWLVFTMEYFSDRSHSSTSRSPNSSFIMRTPAPVAPVMESALHLPPTTANDISRRKLVALHILRESLAEEIHPAELNPDSVTGRKAQQWMAQYDVVSMKLLDAYDYEDSVAFVGNLKKTEDIIDPENHVNKIVERYVKATFYFVTNPDADLSSFHLE